jgi:hypothetical protein
VILRNGEVDRLLVVANRALRQALEHRVVVAALVLAPDDLGRIDAAGAPAGDRYPDMSMVNR